MTDKKGWKRFLGDGKQRKLRIDQMPPAPPWREFMGDEFAQVQEFSQQRWKDVLKLATKDERNQARGATFCMSGENGELYDDVRNAVNAALHLRRPLLVTGKPGSGKTSLAYAVAYELQLGPVLRWPVNSRSVLRDVLYQYDAVARLQDTQLENKRRSIGDYIRLGPVGTAFLPSELPRVLLIDEIDKCDINLPNELLDLFEEGRYEIPELVRCRDECTEVEVGTADIDVPAIIKEGRVLCREFPVIVMTSNGERDFPPAFLRRCLRLRMPDPHRYQKVLERIVATHLRRAGDDESWEQLQQDISRFVENFREMGSDETADIATDQLLNIVYLLTREVRPDENEHKQLKDLLLKGLSKET